MARSSIGRALVSKASGWGFESLRASVSQENEEDTVYDKIVVYKENGNDQTIIIWCVTHKGPKSVCGCK